jgi:GNAT superfamily N-acetyltransferase
MTADPFAALGLPADPALTDEDVRAAWREIAAATHPDRPDGGDVPRYTAAASAYAALRTPWGRSEAYADLITAAGPYVPAPAAPPGPPVTARAARTARALALVPARARHGRPARLLARAIIAAGLSLLALRIAPGQPAGPAAVAGLITWFALTPRGDLAPPPGR